eukprot:Unigene10631_Nuclearia_a/m.32499 Unigene10631_Nuclearia_a/g.32499  ORF Unigene10631_Nuclearia_a/g.32499 Unigene10631_Nuclearia_a/m.32499 type:complete len:395 (+) Unigene10631_Nuclearia_a:209-1393(+)
MVQFVQDGRYQALPEDEGAPPPPPASQQIKQQTATTTQVAGLSAEQRAKLQALKDLYEQGFITQAEYRERRVQLVDEITGTRTRLEGGSVVRDPRPPPTVVARPPPDFGALAAENALKHVFSVKTGKWTATRVKVKIEAEPFARGGLRKAYHLQDLSDRQRDSAVTYVAKMAIDPDEDRETYFQDAEMQCFAAEWAKKFNQSNPPKKIDFVQAWILELVDRENHDLCAVERFIAGPYRKHNNNFGFVNEDERNTPQAFSHFTYEASGHTILVCDIQGVGDLYTDPQMHTINGVGFGKGNLGPRGFDKFLSTHRCNAICKYLRLPPINAKLVDYGTVPATPLMSYQRVDILNVTLPPSSQLHAQLTSSTPLRTPSRTVSTLVDDDKSRGCCCAIL